MAKERAIHRWYTRERERERVRERERDRGKERENVCERVCVCEREREREWDRGRERENVCVRERVCVCVWERERVREREFSPYLEFLVSSVLCSLSTYQHETVDKLRDFTVQHIKHHCKQEKILHIRCQIIVQVDKAYDRRGNSVPHVSDRFQGLFTTTSFKACVYTNSFSWAHPSERM